MLPEHLGQDRHCLVPVHLIYPIDPAQDWLD